MTDGKTIPGKCVCGAKWKHALEDGKSPFIVKLATTKCAACRKSGEGYTVSYLDAGGKVLSAATFGV